MVDETLLELIKNIVDEKIDLQFKNMNKKLKNSIETISLEFLQDNFEEEVYKFLEEKKISTDPIDIVESIRKDSIALGTLRDYLVGNAYNKDNYNKIKESLVNDIKKDVCNYVKKDIKKSL